MQHTCFLTDGPFDLSALDTFGMNAKPNSDNPIGYFGTGLKYAIAVLLREKAKFDIYCNGDHYTMYLGAKKFRGKVFDIVRYKKVNWSLTLKPTYKNLSYTTELGKNWQLWQAFRELYANTLDEDGQCWTTDRVGVQEIISKLSKDQTLIVVEHFEFANLVATKDQIFLNPQREVKIDHHKGNVTEGKSAHVYYRGMRALDLAEDQRAMFTYNIIEEQELTEDRTLKSPYFVKKAVEEIVEKSTDKQFIKQVLTAPDKTFERELDFSYAFGASPEFVEVVTAERNNKSLNRSAGAYYSNYISPPKTPKISDNIWNWIVEALESGQQKAYELADTLGYAPNTVDHDEIIKQAYLEAMQEKMDR